jgi:DNA-binding transcriptional LysR family regulator
MDVELRHLRVLCAVADVGSISRAAAGMGSSQPALTASVQRIERAFGEKLFVRSSNGVVPTQFGDCVLSGARAVLTAADALHRDAEQWLASGTERPIALGGIEGSLVLEVADQLGRPGHHLPAVSVRTDFSPARLLALLSAGQLDAAVVADYPGHELPLAPGVLWRTLGVQPVFVALGADHPAAAEAEIDLARLADERWVLGPSDGGGWPESFEEACRQAGFRPLVAHRITELRALQRLIAAGRAISPCRIGFPATPEIVVRPLAGDPLWMRYLLAWRTGGVFGRMPETLLAAAGSAYGFDVANSPAYRDWRAARGDLVAWP